MKSNAETTTGSNSSLQSQTKIMGFGTELADSLNRYATWRLSPDPTMRKKAEELINTHYLNWFKKCPHVENICFADITFFSPDQISVRDALTIVFTPEPHGGQANYDNYIHVLKDEYLKNGEGHTMAPHEVFAAGLPRFANGFHPLPNPETKGELKPFFSKVLVQNLSSSITNGFFWQELADTLTTEPHVVSKEFGYKAKEMERTYAKGQFTDTLKERVSERPISDQFSRWVEVWQNETNSNRQLSASGLPIRHLIAAPLGFRDPTSLADYTLVACVFLAVDNVDEADVLQILRYMFLHLVEANAMSWVLRKGELTGSYAAAVPAAHEISRVINAIRPAASDSACKLVRTYFKQLLGISRETNQVSSSLEIHEDLTCVTGRRVTFRLEELVREQLLLAAKVEALVTETQKDAEILGKMSKPAFDEIMAEATRMVEANSSFEKLTTCMILCAEEHKPWFALAIVAAIRNAIRHSKPKKWWHLSFDLCKIEETQCLVLNNGFETDAIPVDSEGKPRGGTLWALSSYARSYQKDPRLASLKQTSIESVTGKQEDYRIQWQTILPLPGNE